MNTERHRWMFERAWVDWLIHSRRRAFDMQSGGRENESEERRLSSKTLLRSQFACLKSFSVVDGFRRIGHQAQKP